LAVSWSLLVLLSGCPSSDSSQGEGATCDSAAENLTKICGTAFAGEDFRALCEIESHPYVPQRTRDCVAVMTECEKEAAEACGIRSVVFGCRVAADCPKPFLCDERLGECARCLEDTDCAANRGCLSGLCYDKDAEHYKAFKGLLGNDAGVSAD
jgi:hypothetical protein